MNNFWDYNVWGTFILLAVLMGGLLAGNVLKKSIGFLRESLIPTSVLGGLILLLISSCFKIITRHNMYDSALFGQNGSSVLEILTYHCLALGFIASTLKISEEKFTKARNIEIFNTGVTTVSTYLIQGILGLGITIIAAMIVKDFFSAAGVLLPFGFGQGTGQAMNYGNIYQTEYGFFCGRNFGLTIAAIGFLCASIGGVIHLNIIRRRGVVPAISESDERLMLQDIQKNEEIPMQESIDKMTIQLALIGVTYLLTFGCMYALGTAVPGMKSVIYGFNFLIGVFMAILVKAIMKGLRNKGAIKKQYTNNFLMTRASNLFFDIMVTAGIAAIRLDLLQDYWGILIILALTGMAATYIFNRIVAKALFPAYSEEQFLVMYGMLTGTASTGIILLRELDRDFKTPAADNLVYQNIPAIIFGFPMMLIAPFAPLHPGLTLLIMLGFLTAMLLILFRSKIFRRRMG